jgi:hypothetical protein
VSPRLIDLTGQRFGRLLVLGVHPERVRYGKNKRAVAALWHCVCACGEQRFVFGSNLRQGLSRSCGCLIRDTTTKRNTKHGHARRGKHTREYDRWVCLRQRCKNPNNKSYPNYGGREPPERPIGVCLRWDASYANYYADTGDTPPGMSIDRINNDGDYEPDNWQWATASLQARNQRPRKRKARRAKLADIEAYAAALSGGGVCSRRNVGRAVDTVIRFPLRRLGAVLICRERDGDGWSVLHGSNGWLHGSRDDAMADAAAIAAAHGVRVVEH